MQYCLLLHAKPPLSPLSLPILRQSLGTLSLTPPGSHALAGPVCSCRDRQWPGFSAGADWAVDVDIPCVTCAKSPSAPSLPALWATEFDSEGFGCVPSAVTELLPHRESLPHRARLTRDHTFQFTGCWHSDLNSDRFSVKLFQRSLASPSSSFHVSLRPANLFNSS